MATGDITFFDEALDTAFFGGWGTADDIKVAILDNTTTPTAGDTTPARTETVLRRKISCSTSR